MKRPLVRREVIGFGLIVGIVLGIVLDVRIKHSIIIYTAQAQEDNPKEVLIEVEYNWTKDRIKEEAKKKADQYGVPFVEMWNTILCESGASTTIQSLHHYTFTDAKKGIYKGEREKSLGLAQIHLPDHPDVTEEQAKNPEFSLDFMAKNWDTVRWYCRKPL